MNGVGFIHSDLDEFGLTAPQFRVFCHLLRCAGSTGMAWPSLDTIARVCRLDIKTVQAALKHLVKIAAVSKEKRPGLTCRYKPNPIDKWRPDPNNHQTRSATKVAERLFSTAETHRDHPTQSAPDEVCPVELIPEGNPSFNTTPAKIYESYPKKVGQPAALRAIHKALSKISAEQLLEKTKAFAALWGEDKTYCPYPATWFNQERFNDDPITWKADRRAERRPNQRHETIDIPNL